MVLWKWRIAIAGCQHIPIKQFIFGITGDHVGACKAGRIIHALTELIAEQIRFVALLFASLDILLVKIQQSRHEAEGNQENEKCAIQE
jgi:hypothetical protein